MGLVVKREGKGLYLLTCWYSMTDICVSLSLPAILAIHFTWQNCLCMHEISLSSVQSGEVF